MTEFLQPEVYFAIFGSLGIKLLELAELHKLPKLERPDLKDWLYWAPFTILPFVGGVLAFAYLQSGHQLSPILAINIGVSAPLIIRAMVKTAENPVIKTQDTA